jgi:hypothetical protein
MRHHLSLHHEVRRLPEDPIRDSRLRRETKHHESRGVIGRGLEDEGPDALDIARGHQDHRPLEAHLCHDHPRSSAAPIKFSSQA